MKINTKNFFSRFYCIEDYGISSDETCTRVYIPIIKTTLQDLLNHIYQDKESWGYITIEQIKCKEEYAHGKFIEDVRFSAASNGVISKMKVGSGWTRVDYDVELKIK